jgi:hypothetical protein
VDRSRRTEPRERHRIRPGEDDDFAVRNIAEIVSTRTETARLMSMPLGAVAGAAASSASRWGAVGALVAARLGALALDLDVIALATACAVATGLFFGYYPARKAARLDPEAAPALAIGDARPQSRGVRRGRGGQGRPIMGAHGAGRSACRGQTRSVVDAHRPDRAAARAHAGQLARTCSSDLPRCLSWCPSARITSTRPSCAIAAVATACSWAPSTRCSRSCAFVMT